MRPNSLKNKLIVLLNLSGSYKGGAQRRYLALFNYLQNNNQNDYFLLLNDSLFKECFNDHILTVNKNVICIPIKYGRIVLPKKKQSIVIRSKNRSTGLKQKSRLYHFFGLISSFLKQFKAWTGYSFQLMKIIKRFNIGVIYGVFTGGIWSWQVARLLNIKFIFSYNDSAANMIERNILRIFSSEYYPLKFADKVDFLSVGILKKLKEKGVNFKENKVLFTPNSFIIYKNFYAEHPKNNWIIFSARLTKIKNPQLLLEAVSILKHRSFTEFSLYFLGEGILLQDLVKQKDEFKLENVFFEGGVSDTAKYLRQSKIFISIQEDNNYPSQSLLEAMSCENAIIASDVGETRRLVTKDEGILVPLSAAKIADAIQFLVSNPGECEYLGMNGRNKVLEEHNIEKYSEYFFEITKY
jgi:glycosyltransferase involved in cell wall biosynthesis